MGRNHETDRQVDVSLPQRERREKYGEHSAILVWSVKKTPPQKRGTRKTKAGLILYIFLSLAPLMAGPINLTFGCWNPAKKRPASICSAKRRTPTPHGGWQARG